LKDEIKILEYSITEAIEARKVLINDLLGSSNIPKSVSEIKELQESINYIRELRVAIMEEARIAKSKNKPSKLTPLVHVTD